MRSFGRSEPRPVIRPGAAGRTEGNDNGEGTPMGATQNAELIRRGYAAFNSGDVDTLVEIFAEDIVWHVPGSSKLGGDHVGRDATLAMFGAYGAAAEGTLRADLIDVMASDGRVAGWATDTAATATRSLETSAVVIFAIRDGKVTEAWHHFGDQEAFDAFLA